MFKKTIFSIFALAAILTLAGQQGYAQTTAARTTGWAARAASAREQPKEVTSTRAAAALGREAMEQKLIQPLAAPMMPSSATKKAAAAL